MTADSSRDVQAGIYACLADVPALEGKVFDHVPQGTAFPYVVIGEMAAQDFGTQDFSGNEMDVTLHVYSQARGWQETQDILSTLRNALDNADFFVPNQILILCRHAGAELRAEADGETRHGLVRFHIITEPA